MLIASLCYIKQDGLFLVLFLMLLCVWVCDVACRAKLTKLPVNKQKKKELTGAIKELVNEQVGKLGKKGKKGQAAAQPAASGPSDMQE